jgi:hypothetical protein
VSKTLLVCLVLGLPTTSMCPAVLAQMHAQTVYQLRSRDIANPPPELLELCEKKAAEVPIPGEVEHIAPLNAELWTSWTHFKNGKVGTELVRKVGSSNSCSFVLSTKDGPLISLYGDGEVLGISFEGWGECHFPVIGLPTPSSYTGTCNMVLTPDAAQGIAGGIATSNSIVGEDTGSFWTIRIFWD